MECWPNGLHHLEFSSEILQALRTKPFSEMSRNGKDGSLWAAFWRPHVSSTLRQPERCYNILKGTCTMIKTARHQWGKSAFPEQHSTALATEDPNMHLQGGGAAVDPPFPSHRQTPCDTGSGFPDVRGRGLQGSTPVSFCPSLRFNPGMGWNIFRTTRGAPRL